METNFTRGPWVAIPPKERWISNGHDLTSYCVMSEKTRGHLIDEGCDHYRPDPNYVDNVNITGDVFVRDMSLEEACANAHLIAAAPCLYEALEMIIKDFDDPKTSGITLPVKTYKAVQAALKKARGSNE